MPKPKYVFVRRDGVGPNAISPHSSWALEDIYDALQGATGSILCVFEGERFVAAVQTDDALVRFGFRYAYPVCAGSENPDVRKIAKIAARYWLKHELDREQLTKAQDYYARKYGRRFEGADFCAAVRLLGGEPHEVGSAPLLAGLRLNRAVLVKRLLAGARACLEAVGDG